MKKNYLTIIGLLFITTVAYSKMWVISDARIEVTFDDQTSLISVRDKRINKIWSQVPSAKFFAVSKTTAKNNSLTVRFAGDYEATITLTPSSAVEVTLFSYSKAPFQEITFPSAFATPGNNHYLLHTDGEGFLLAVDDTVYPLGRSDLYTMRGLSMPWLGITDKDFESGYMAILDTPDDAAFDTKRVNDLITFEPVWLSSRNEFKYKRKVIYHFFDTGGYVAQCKKYREHVWAQNGNGITLSEKEKKFPAIKKMMGAVHIYLWDDGRTVSFAEELKQSGIDKAFILWNPNHLPYPEKGYDTKIKDLGYLSGVYELFRDTHLRDTVKRAPVGEDGTYLNRFLFPGLFRQIALVQKDGKYHHSGFGYDVNPKTILPLIPELRTDRELAIYPHEAFFLDGFLASGLFEDYGKINPLTRTQYKKAVVDMNVLFAEKYKMVVGMEWGADYGVPTTAFAHGMTTLHRRLYSSKDRNRKGSIYYYGDWKNNRRPSIMLSSYVADAEYHRWAINEKIRVPLYQLVYHDAIVTTWRWDDANHHMPEIWWKKDLFNILYGTAPVWTMDVARWQTYRENFIDSYKNICPWLGKIGYDELLSHRFLSADHAVQETVFSSGKTAIVNFGDQGFEFEGKIVPARGFILDNR